MIKNVVIVIVAFCLFCGVASGELVSGKTEIPVEWNRNISYPVNTNVNNISEFEILLEKQWEDTLSVTIKDGHVVNEQTINNCTELINVYKEKINIIQGDRQYIQAWRVSCESFKRIAVIQPAKVSFIGDIHFSDFCVKSFLCNLSKVRIPSDYGPYRLFFESLNNTQSICYKKEISCRVITEEEIFTFIPLATGDVNLDGVQDLLLQANSSSRASGGSLSIGVVLTKTSLNGEFKILDWW